MSSVARNSLLVLVVWAALYLPFLGTSELRGEEGRRVIPAVEMLDSGDFLVPHIGGQPYLKKPPLVSWIIAGVFKVTGVRNEWTARLPSAVATLVAALFFVIGGRRVLGDCGALVAALAWLINLGLVQKGRVAEIEALYVALFAIAFILWLVAWQEGRSGWRTWVLPWFFLGLGMLAKGPAHLLFWYPIVIAVLWRCGRLRDLVRPAHLVALALVFAMFAAWAVPFFRSIHNLGISQAWRYEAYVRVFGGENSGAEWPMNFPRGITYFFPWFFVFPFVRWTKMDERQRQIAIGLFWGALAPFVIVLLLPGTLPRYVLPTLIPIFWLLGMAVRDNAFTWSVRWRRFSISTNPRLIWGLVVVLSLITILVVPARTATFLVRHSVIRPIAAKVNRVLPPGEPLYAVNPLFQPYLFYVHSPVRYVSTVDELPAATRYFITLPQEQARVEASTRWAPLHPKLMLATPEYRGHATILFKVE